MLLYIIYYYIKALQRYQKIPNCTTFAVILFHRMSRMQKRSTLHWPTQRAVIANAACCVCQDTVVCLSPYLLEAGFLEKMALMRAMSNFEVRS